MSALDSVINSKNIPFAVAGVFAFIAWGLASNASKGGDATLIFVLALGTAVLFLIVGLIVHVIDSAKDSRRTRTKQAEAAKAAAETEAEKVRLKLLTAKDRVVPLSDGYAEMVEFAETRLREANGSRPFRIYIRNFERLKESATELVKMDALLEVVSKNIDKVRTGQERNSIKLYILYTDSVRTPKTYGKLQDEFLKKFAKIYRDTFPEEQKKDIDSTMGMLNHYVHPLRVANDDVGSLIMIDESRAKLFIKLDSNEAKIRDFLEKDAPEAKVYAAGLDKLFGTMYKASLQSITKDVYYTVKSNPQIYVPVEGLHNESVIAALSKATAAYDILSLNAYCIFLSENNVAGVLEEQAKAHGIRMNNLVVDPDSTELAEWEHENKYSRASIRTHLDKSERYFDSRKELFTCSRYGHLPACRLIFIDDNTLLLSFYEDLDKSQQGLELEMKEDLLPVYILNKVDHKDIFQWCREYFDIIALRATPVSR